MALLPHSSLPADRRIVAALRVPVQELGCSLPGALEPVALRGQALILIDYALRTPTALSAAPLGEAGALARVAARIWPPRLTTLEHHLAIRVPVRTDGGEGRTTLWVPRRYTSSRAAACSIAPHRDAARAERASFELRLEGFHLELEVRGENGRVVYLEGETSGDMGRSIFRRPRTVEDLLDEWSCNYRAAGWCAGLDRPDVGSEHEALHPMHMHALQTSVLPELFPGIEEQVELDCVLRQVSQRPTPARTSRRAYLEELARKGRGDMDAPPAGAFCVRG